MQISKKHKKGEFYGQAFGEDHIQSAYKEHARACARWKLSNVKLSKVEKMTNNFCIFQASAFINQERKLSK